MKIVPFENLRWSVIANYVVTTSTIEQIWAVLDTTANSIWISPHDLRKKRNTGEMLGATNPVMNLSSNQIHFEFTFKLMVSSFWGLLSSSPWTHKMSSHCEFAVNFHWVSRSHHELAVRYSWDHPMTHHAVVAMGLLWELQTHGKLTASSQQAHLVSTLWAR